MGNLKFIGICIPILSQKSTFFGILKYFFGKTPFLPKFLDFEECKVQFSKKPKHENLGFDSNSGRRGHKLSIRVCFKIMTRLLREPIEISSKNRFLFFRERIYFEFPKKVNKPA
jgi:hypothetical protein